MDNLATAIFLEASYQAYHNGPPRAAVKPLTIPRAIWLAKLYPLWRQPR